VSAKQLACLGLVLAARFTSIAPEAPVSPRNASYTVEVALDPEARTLSGTQLVEWRNLQQQPTAELWFHLYWNAWRNNRSTWMLEDRLGERSAYSRAGVEIDEGDWSWIEVDSIRLVGDDPSLDPLDLTGSMGFVSPDDGNPDDRTVLVVTLPRPVEPGETVRVALDWRSKIPRTFARTGFRGDYYFIAQWFPKLGVYEPAGWNCHQFHNSTEFYSDYGVYDVAMTVPEAWVLGATGREVGRQDNADATVTHRYYQEDVHDFAWTASPDFIVREERFEEPGLPPVDLRLLIRPEHLDQAERYSEAAKAGLLQFGTWYGPYPYGHVTVVDPAYESGSGGMEYPTLITGGTRLFAPERTDRPEGVTVHEMGHQFWYGLVGNNEFEHAWIDEGINTFSTIRALDATYEPPVHEKRYFEGFFPLRQREITVSRFQRRIDSYRDNGTRDAPSRPSFLYHPKSRGAITYDKSLLWLATLENHLGWETLQRSLSTFFERYRFGHPTAVDFVAVVEETAGEELDWFFDQVLHDSVEFDYSVDSVSSERAALEGWVEQGEDLVYVSPDEESDGEGVYRTEVVVRRLGGGTFPVDVRLVFEDDFEILEQWDGQERWKRFVVERNAKLAWAGVDPERVLMLDVERTNNSRVLEAESMLPAVKWSSKWMIWLQDMMATFAFFI
jgi:hypothetical protein